MVVGPHILSTVIRQTAINVSKALQEDKGKPFTIRKFLIETFIQKNKQEQPLHHHLAAQLVS